MHKGLEDFFYDGTVKGIQAKHAKKLADILDRLDAASCIEDMNYPSANLHPLKKEWNEFWVRHVFLGT